MFVHVAAAYTTQTTNTSASSNGARPLGACVLGVARSCFPSARSQRRPRTCRPAHHTRGRAVHRARGATRGCRSSHLAPARAPRPVRDKGAHRNSTALPPWRGTQWVAPSHTPTRNGEHGTASVELNAPEHNDARTSSCTSSSWRSRILFINVVNMLCAA